MDMIVSKILYKNGAIWVDSGKLKASLIENEFLDELTQLIANNKEELQQFLSDNHVFCKQDFKKRLIYKLKKEKYPLSFAQHRMLYIVDHYEQGAHAYNIPWAREFSAGTDTDALKKALQHLVSRHEALRCVLFEDESGNQYQRVLSDVLLFAQEEVSAQYVNQYLERAANYIFNLREECPIKCWLFHVKETNAMVVMITFHHVVADEWSLVVFETELGLLYTHYATGSVLELAELTIQYKDFALWQHQYLQGARLRESKNYWLSHLSDYEPLQIAKDYPRPAKFDYQGNQYKFSIDPVVAEKLRSLAQSSGLTLYSIVLSGFYILLSRYTGQQDIVIGILLSNRQYPQLEGLIGLLVNILAVRMPFTTEDTAHSVLDKTNDLLTKAQQFQDFPFDTVVDLLKEERTASHHPIFQVIFNFKQEGGAEHATARLLDGVPIELPENTTKFDLGLTVSYQKGLLLGAFKYAIKLFKSDTIERLAVCYQSVLKQMVTYPTQRVSEYALLSAEAYQLMVYDWNNTRVSYPNAKTIHQLFEEQVKQSPDQIAVVFEDQALTYGQLNAKANQLARCIRKQYNKQNKVLKADTLISLCLNRSLEMVVAILGVLKSGGAYVPIDPNYPDDRITYILHDTSSLLVLTQTATLARLKRLTPSKPSINYIRLDVKPYRQEVMTNLELAGQGTDLAYVMYTSGTTGKPKGVMIAHHSWINVVSHHKKTLSLMTSCEKIAQFSAIMFDPSCLDIAYALLNGYELHILSNTVRSDLRLIFQYIVTYRISYIDLPTALYEQIQPDDVIHLKTLKYVVIGGEKLQTSPHHPNAHYTLINSYGPTECTVHASVAVYVGDAQPVVGELSSRIGFAIDNTQLYVLDALLRPVPMGVVGELFIGGAGLARGYLNNPELTRERFIFNPFSTAADKEKGYIRLYKTGDLVKWRPDGELEYIGRNDFQVKIHGYRIELGEIEHALNAHEAITQSVVLVKERETARGIKHYLVAYYVCDYAMDERVLMTYLALRLPEYMLPSALIPMDVFPVTANGKLDRNALPKPDSNRCKLSYVAPETVFEATICAIWQDVLRIPCVGIRDDFFRIGGDSILCIQLTARLRQQGIHCSVKDIFDCRCIERLALQIAESTEKELTTHAEQGFLSGVFDLLPIQVDFFEHAYCAFNHYNQSFMVRVPELTLDTIESIWKTLVLHHDMLRVRYTRDATGQYQQSYSDEMGFFSINTVDVSLEAQECREATLNKVLTQWQSDFDIASGPLWHVGYLHGFEDRSARLVIALHHLIVDAVSWRIIIEHFNRLYQGTALAEKGSSYRQWVAAVKDYVWQHPEERRYWQEQHVGLPDYRDALVSFAEHESTMRLDKKITPQLLTQASMAYNTEINDLLLTALVYALKSWHGTDCHALILEGHGRELIDASLDISQTIGWFTTIFPVKLEVQSSLGVTIKYIKEHLRSIPNKGIGYGAFKYYDQTSQLRHQTLPLISFNYLGQFGDSSGDWQLLDAFSGVTSAPENKTDLLINMNGYVIDGVLSFKIETKLEEASHLEFIAAFRAHLIALTAHCTNQVAQGFLSYTPNDFPTIKISSALLDKLAQKYPIEAIYPANSLQQGFIYRALVNPEDDAYRVQIRTDYYNRLDVPCYKKAWQLAIQTYPALRICFNWDEQLIQLVNKTGRLEFTEHDISGQANKEEAWHAIQVSDRAQPFNLQQPTLLRLHLIKYSEKHYALLESVHHSIGDGWSGAILLNKVHAYYYQLIENKVPMVIEETTYLYAQAYLAANKVPCDEYWDKKLNQCEQANNIQNLLSVTTDVTTPLNGVIDLQKARITIGGKIWTDLKKCIIAEGVTPNVILQFAWHNIIRTYSQDQQTIVGTVISGRTLPLSGMESSVGLYINTLPLILDWERSQTVREVLQSLHQSVMELNHYSAINLAHLQREGKPLFHSLLVYENYPEFSGEHHGPDALHYHTRRAIEKGDYKLSLTGYETGDSLNIIFSYDAALLYPDKAALLLEQLSRSISQIPEKISDSCYSLQLMSSIEYQHIVYDWNASVLDYARDYTIHYLFEQQAKNTPEAIALVFETNEWTYRMLNEKANQVAGAIVKHHEEKGNGLTADTMIALCFKPSLEMVVAILAVLKSGAAYVPIDPQDPWERIDYILQDTKTRLLLTHAAVSPRLHGITTPCEHLLLDKDVWHAFSKENLNRGRSCDLAYVIYTSGTTGSPKGVMVEHQDFLFYQETFNALVNNPRGISTTLTLSYCFDASLPTLFAPLISGGKVILTHSLLDIGKDPYLAMVEKHQVSVIRLTPSLLYYLADELSHYSQPLIIVMGGETYDSRVIDKILANTQITLFNQYGPTECVVGSCATRLKGGEVGQIIGKPYCGKRAYILDESHAIVPIGVVGELFIGGAGMARGYLNQANLTNERFIDNPFTTTADKEQGYNRLYKTGDRVRWLTDGRIEYLGRRDFQVKIHGYRIELQAIEHALLACHGIKQAVVVAKERLDSSGLSPYLVGYYIASEPMAGEDIRNQLALRLPHYMLPSVLLPLDAWPMTVNGKLDRKALPDVECKTTEDYVAPRNTREEKIVNIWQEVLGVERIGIRDNFFKLGGHSILAMQASHRMSQQTEFVISVTDIFKYKNIQCIIESHGLVPMKTHAINLEF